MVGERSSATKQNYICMKIFCIPLKDEQSFSLSYMEIAYHTWKIAIFDSLLVANAVFKG